jgi:F0F1-type ATP synthase assembly protein I
MAEQSNEEKRTSVRAELATRVKIQPVSREEFEESKSVQISGVPAGIPLDEGGLSDGQLGYLLGYLNRIEEKLDQVMQKLDPDACGGETSTYGMARNISGAGVNLILDEAFEEGQLVLISLSVPGFSIGFLQAYGEVVRVEPVTKNNRQTFETSIKFLVISEDEREKLISYAFYMQRQAIRESVLAKERDQEASGNGR